MTNEQFDEITKHLNQVLHHLIMARKTAPQRHRHLRAQLDQLARQAQFVKGEHQRSY